MSNAFLENEGSAHRKSGSVPVEKGDVLQSIQPNRRVVNPITPIPARASAHPAQKVSVRPRYPRISAELEREDLTQLPTQPPVSPLWKYESAGFAAESSLSTLSLIVPTPSSSPVSPTIDELDTVPEGILEGKQATYSQRKSADVATIDTQPPLVEKRDRKTIRLALDEEIFAEEPVQAQSFSLSLRDQPSWTAGRGANSLFAQRIAQRSSRMISKKTLAFHPFDRVRWWLLYPGRLEFVLWLTGTLLLLAATCLLIFASLLSVGPVPESSASSSTRTDSAAGCSYPRSVTACGSMSVTSEAGVKLIVLDVGQIPVGRALHLKGQGFTAHGLVNLTYDAWLLCQPATTRADAYGSFEVAVLLTHAGAGEHRVVAYDVSSTHTVLLPVKLAGLSTSGVITATPVVVPPISTPPVPLPGITPTAVSSQPTVVPVAPTVVPTITILPTATPVRPTPTVQATAQPTPKPPVKVTPTPGVIAPTPTATAIQTKNTHVIALSLLPISSLFAQPTVLFSKCWLWLLALIYTIAIACLSLTAVLLNRRRAIHGSPDTQ